MNDILDRITGFLTEIGICFTFEPLPEKTFLPGLELRNGMLIIDREKLSYPGDVLHEASFRNPYLYRTKRKKAATFYCN